jgi:hypothetical protein
VNNVNGTSDNTCKCRSWLEHWSKFGGGILPPSCREKVCTKNLEFGTRVQKDSFKDKGWYIVPLCKDHNGQTGKSLDIMDGTTLVSADVSQTCGKQLLWSQMKHSELRWNPGLQEWLCVRCGLTSDHSSREDAETELESFECQPYKNPLNKPHLVILVEVGRIPTRGGCSACKDVLFTTGHDIGTAQEQHSKLESLFREHFRKVHMHEDASQKAAGS